MTTDGQTVEVLSTGLHNKDAGPDFFSADVIIGDDDWMGNVEVHTKSSDWYRHGHDKDRAYNNVILHVVEQADTEAMTQDGRTVPQLVLQVPEYVVNNYEHLQAYEDYPPCYRQVTQVPRIILDRWMERLCGERLERKAAEIEMRLRYCEHDWERVLFITMARAFGFGVNTDAFEEWARLIPYSGAAKHRDDLFQIEALFLGQAGLLDTDMLNPQQRQMAPSDEYYQRLQREYRFLATKFTLTPMDGYKWKMLRLRPHNFPTLRLAQFASLYHSQRLSLSALIDARDVKEVHHLLDIEVSPYWQNHFNLCMPQTTKMRHALQSQALDLLTLNGVIPTLYAYASYRQSDRLMHKALTWLQDIPAEDNKHTRLWRQLGFNAANAAQSQAVIQLITRYCNRKDCLRCQLGYQFIKRKQA